MKADLSDAFGSIRYPCFWRTCHKRMGPAAARPMMKTTMGHSLVLSWHRASEEDVPFWRGCTFGAPESILVERGHVPGFSGGRKWALVCMPRRAPRSAAIDCRRLGPTGSG